MNSHLIDSFKVYISSDEQLKMDLESIFKSAGFEVVFRSINVTKDGINQMIEESNCFILALNSHYDLQPEINLSFEHYEYLEAEKKLLRDKNFKLFIWFRPELSNTVVDKKQEELIKLIRNNLRTNMIFTSIHSPIYLVDEIRSMLKVEEKKIYNLKEVDVFLSFNQLDQSEADEIIDLLSDIVNVEKLNIIQEMDEDYAEIFTQQIAKSKLAVVYFKESADWALPFAQQVWKKAGGASLNVPILFIGDEKPDTNKEVLFNAPKVVSIILPGELIPLEIKVQFDKVVE